MPFFLPLIFGAISAATSIAGVAVKAAGNKKAAAAEPSPEDKFKNDLPNLLKKLNLPDSTIEVIKKALAEGPKEQMETRLRVLASTGVIPPEAMGDIAKLAGQYNVPVSVIDGPSLSNPIDRETANSRLGTSFQPFMNSIGNPGFQDDWGFPGGSGDLMARSQLMRLMEHSRHF